MKKQPDDKNPATASLYTPHAIDEFVELLMQMPDPDIVMQERGISRADLRRLEADDEISTALETRVAAVASTPWSISPAEGTIATFVREQLEAHIDNIINAAWKATPYGYSVQEVVYRQGAKFIEWKDIEERPFELFEPKSDGRLMYYPETGGSTGMGVSVHDAWPGQFFLTRRRPTYRNPYGEALLSRAFWPWFFRNNGWKFWAKFIERFGSPLLVGKTEGSTPVMASKLAAAIQSAVIAIGKDDDITAISPANAGDSFDRFSTAVDKRIQKLILGQTLTTDSHGVGSQALGNVHNEVRDDRRISDIKMVTTTVQAMIDTLLVVNGYRAGEVLFVMEDETGLQTDRAERDAKLATAKIVKFTPAYLTRFYDFEEGDFTIPEDAAPQPPQPGQEPPATPRKGIKASLKLAASVNRFTPSQEEVETVADGALEDAPNPIAPHLILRAIKAARTPDELAELLAEIYDGDDNEAFQAVLERALFTADLLGYVHMDAASRSKNPEAA